MISVLSRFTHPPRRPALWPAAVVTALGLALLIGGLRDGLGWKAGTLTAAFVVPMLVAFTALRAAGRCDDARRQTWRWVAAGIAAWGFGQLYFGAQTIVFNDPPAVPSPADLGYLLLPVCAMIALWRHPVTVGIQATQRIRLLLDTVTITVALILAGWQLPIGEFWSTTAGAATRAVMLAYPISDVLLATLICIMLAYGAARQDRHLSWLMAGLLAFAAADFIYWRTTEGGPGDVLVVPSLLWAAGLFFMIICASAERGGGSGRSGGSRGSGVTGVTGTTDAPSYVALPYLLLVASVLIVVVSRMAGRPLDLITEMLLTGVALLVYTRQLVLLRENRSLLGQVRVSQQRLDETRMRDQLTGLPNLAGFLLATDEMLAEDTDGTFTVVKFRPYHTQALDQVSADEIEAIAAELARRIGDCCRPADLMGRLSEVTFAVLVAGDQSTALRFAQKVMLTMDPSVPTPRHRLQLNLVAGIAAARPPVPGITAAEPSAAGPTAVTLMQHAAIALANATVPGGIAILTPEMMREHADQFSLRESLLRTLREDHPDQAVDVHFEPVVELASDRLTGLAARPAWNEPRHGPVSAGRLLATAREAGLGSRVDETVLEQAIIRFGTWNRRWPGRCGELWITVCIETLIKRLSDQTFSERVLRLLQSADLPASTLVLELLDGFDGRDDQHNLDEVGAVLHRLHTEGVRFAASDAMVLTGSGPTPGFGAASGVKGQVPAVATMADGYVTADYFDISPLLVERCVDDLRARRVVQATIEFAADHNAATAARQVTTIEQHEELLRAGCTLARGPLYGDSQPAEPTAELLAAVADGSWRTPAGRVALRHRSSWAWQELRQVVSGLPIAAFACDLDGKVILAEGALLDELGGAAAAIDQPLVTLLASDSAFDLDLDRAEDADDPARDERPVRDALADALDGVPAVTAVRVNGRLLQVHLSPGHAGDGVVTGALGVAIDITHRVEAEQALRQSEQRFKSVFEQAPVGMAIITPDGRLEKTNAALSTMTGFPAAGLWGKPIRELWHQDSPLENRRGPGQPGAEAGPYHGERAYKHKDGSAVWTRVSVAPLRGASAQGTTIAIIEDIRQLKQLEVELRHAQKLEAVGMLAAGIAHEINTPIQFVGDNLDFLADAFGRLTHALTARQRLTRPVDEAAAAELAEVLSELDLPWLMEEVPGAVQQSLEGVARVATIVRAMRNFGHPDQQGPTPIDVNAAIRDTATVARNEYKYVADLQLELGEVPPVPGYPSQFHQVVLNLIVNAAHAIADVVDGTERRGTIKIRTWSDLTEVHVSITDDGCGMSEETRERIFEPFFTTKAVGRGTGQGLTIVHTTVVDKHHGSINVDTALGEGTTFTINLPLPFPDSGADGATESFHQRDIAFISEDRPI